MFRFIIFNCQKNKRIKVLFRKKIVAVVGLGYVGLPILHLIKKRGFNCIGFDIDKSKIKNLKIKKSYISDLSNKQLKIFSSSQFYDMEEISNIKKANYIIFCLPTPLTKNNQPDMSVIRDAFNRTKKFLKKEQTIILESTVYPGATREIFSQYLLKKFTLGKNFFLGYSSERINPGQLYKKQYKYFLYNTPKVISGFNQGSLKKIYNLYKIIFKNLCVTKSMEIAEMSKLVENSYRSVNIGLANELKIICHKLKIDIHEVLDAAKTKPFGFNAFYPGPGVGGHCIPIDPVFVNWIAKKNGVKAEFVESARNMNLNVTKWVINQIFKKAPKIKNKNQKVKILIVGLAYKADVNDIRESPAIKIFKVLLKKNNIVDFNDSKINKIKLFKKTYYSKPISSCSNYNYIVICTNHSDLNKKVLLKKSKKIFDTRNVFKKQSLNKIIKI